MKITAPGQIKTWKTKFHFCKLMGCVRVGVFYISPQVIAEHATLFLDFLEVHTVLSQFPFLTVPILP